jgi:hypothetical protein
MLWIVAGKVLNCDEESIIYALLQYEIYLPVKFQHCWCYIVDSMKITKGMHSKEAEIILAFIYSLHFYAIKSIYLQSFLLKSLVLSDFCPRQSSECKNETKARQIYGGYAFYSMR